VSRQPGSRLRGPEDRLAVFLRGLVIGAFVGALVAGSAVLRRMTGR
jgi:hypothetical protein